MTDSVKCLDLPKYVFEKYIYKIYVVMALPLISCIHIVFRGRTVTDVRPFCLFILAIKCMYV